MMNFNFDSKSIEDDVIRSRSISDTTLSDIDFKNKLALVWVTTLNLVKYGDFLAIPKKFVQGV